MKTLLIIIMATLSFACYSQRVVYTYDNAGNRIQRKYFVIRMADTTQTSVQEQKAAVKTNVFPNPAENYLDVTIEENDKELMVNVYDLQGKLVIQEKLIGLKTRIDVSALKPSTYFLKIFDEGKIIAGWEVLKVY